MQSLGKNIGKLKKIAQITCAALILSLACIIVMNITLTGIQIFQDDDVQHFLNGHKINEISFQFIKIDFDNKYYFENGTSHKISTVAAASIFLVLSMIIFIDLPKTNLLYAEKFLSSLGFKNPIFKPPISVTSYEFQVSSC